MRDEDTQELALELDCLVTMGGEPDAKKRERIAAIVEQLTEAGHEDLARIGLQGMEMWEMAPVAPGPNSEGVSGGPGEGKKFAGREHLVPVTREVKRADGRAYQQTFWMRPTDAATLKGKPAAKELAAMEQRAMSGEREHINELLPPVWDWRSGSSADPVGTPLQEAYKARVLNNPAINKFDPERGSTAETPDAGFPEGHPLRDPVTRAKQTGAAFAALSYSNSVGAGAALRAQAQKDAGQEPRKDDLRKEVSQRLSPGVTLSDLNKAMYQETQGLLKREGVTEMVLYRGTGHEAVVDRLTKGAPDKLVDVSLDVHGFSSFTTSYSKAAEFGNAVIAVRVPASRIMAVPSNFPTEIARGAAAFGGGRQESEVIVTGGEPLIGIVERKASRGR